MLSPTTRNMGASLSPQPDVSGELNTEALTCIVERLESEIIDGSWIHQLRGNRSRNDAFSCCTGQ